jgi:hypothetical protein
MDAEARTPGMPLNSFTSRQTRSASLAFGGVADVGLRLNRP